MSTRTPTHRHSEQLLEPWQAKADRGLAAMPGSLSGDALTATRWVFSLSDFCQQLALRDGDWCAQAIASDAFAAPVDATQLRQPIQDACTGTTTMAELQQVLRLHRNRVQFAAIWRHLLGLASLEETTATLSTLADVCIDAALQRVSQWEFERSGVPLDAQGNEMRLVVLALGKLGAGELNLSSDVDLIFFYPDTGETSQGKTFQQVFVRVGQRLIEALDRRTVDGFVFRVDMRLRPYGDSGPLVMHFDAAESYYASAGRDWERYALIKARVCAGDLQAGADLLGTLRRFVYRRYLDFGALDALRDMKRRLLAERHDTQDVKLGPGGIRDAEFAVQLHQLIWGGREPGLQVAPLLQVLPQLVNLNMFTADQASALETGYRFLRDTEHSLQAFADEQTQALPANHDGLLRLALAMGFAEVAEFEAVLHQHQQAVQRCFAELVTLPDEEADAEDEEPWQAYMHVDRLATLGLQDPQQALQHLGSLHQASERPSVAQEGRDRLAKLMPLLLEQLTSVNNADAALAAVLPLLRVVLRRSAYLVLLCENPQALHRLLDLCGRSLWLAAQVQRTPMLLDALLDERQQEQLPSSAELKQELADHLCPRGLESAEIDAEQWVDRLREFKEQHGFQAGLGQVRGTRPLMKTSDYLTFVAESVLAEALALAWAELRHKAGQPLHISETDAPDPAPDARLSCADVAGFVPRGFVILGFGKMGGIELGPTSDLDLVFLHGLGTEHNQFLLRLVRRLVGFMGMPTATGPLFEIDTRLRPSGRSGTMVTTISAMRDYYRDSAWTWEHQALVRARPVAGDPALAAEFDALRLEILCERRPEAALREDVVNMRTRMLAQQGASESDLKRAPGGIVDIEFMVQYLALAHAHQHPELVQFTDNVRILDAIERVGLLPADQAEALRSAYVALRTESHRADLDLPDTERNLAVLSEHRQMVRNCWHALLGEE